MARKKTREERTQIIARIIELVKEHGRITTKDVMTLFRLHRTTAERYMRIVEQRREFIRHGRCGIFRDLRATIDFDNAGDSPNKTVMESTRTRESEHG